MNAVERKCVDKYVELGCDEDLLSAALGQPHDSCFINEQEWRSIDNEGFF